MRNRKENGITLIALTVTIVVMLIIAGVSLSSLDGQDSSIGQAKDVKTATEYKEAKDVSSRVELDKNNNVNIYVNLIVGSETIIKDLTVDLQNRIKEKVKQSADLEVKEVNITIKKAVQEKQRKIEQA